MKSYSFINIQRQNRRRRYSINSSHIYQSLAGSSSIQRSEKNFSNLFFPIIKTNTEKYNILTKLNIGMFGATYLIRDSNDEQMYILKRIQRNLPKKFRQYLFNEKYLLNFLKSNYIISLISSYIDIKNNCFSMKYEYISGITLLHLVRKFRWLEESIVAFYCAQIVLVFEYLHELNIIYRNLKLETILLTNNGYIKLYDFAYSKLLSSHSSYTYTIIGVPDIIPPEMLLGKPYSYSVDWWQLGVAMFEMLTSYTPFYSLSMFKTHKNVLCNYQHKFPLHISSLAKFTCMKFLEPKITKRLGCSLIGMDAKEVKQNIWFKNHINWTAIIERSQPVPYKIKNFHKNFHENISMLNTIESKWLDEYDQVIQSLMNIE